MMQFLEGQAATAGILFFLFGWIGWLALSGLEAALIANRDLMTSAEKARASGPLFTSLYERPRNVTVSFAIARECMIALSACGAVLGGLAAAGVAGALLFIGLASLLSAMALPCGSLLAAKNSRVIIKMLQPLVAPSLKPAESVTTYVIQLGRRAYSMLRREAPQGDNIFAHDEIATLTTREAAEDLQGPERTLLSKLRTFTDLQVRRIMTPRVDVFALPLGIGSQQLRQELRGTRFSRIPVYRGERENIAGILYLKDLIGRTFERGEFEGLLRKPYFVPATKTAGELFREFRKTRVHMAVVVDEYGGMAGIVTMEDLLEELFGEIRDEFDEGEEHIERRAPGVYLVSARLPLADFASKLNLRVGQGEAENTVGGLIVNRLGRLPRPGETVSMDGFTLKVEEVEAHAIEKVRVELWPLASC